MTFSPNVMPQWRACGDNKEGHNVDAAYHTPDVLAYSGQLPFLIRGDGVFNCVGHAEVYSARDYDCLLSKCIREL